MIDITLDDSAVILKTDYYISGSRNSEFDVKTFP